MHLSIVVPIYNERSLLPEILQRLLTAELPPGLTREIHLVDDFSTDGTREWLATHLPHMENIYLHLHDSNRGKGAALRTGFRASAGDLIVVQDADLEYDPREIAAVLGPLLDGRADVVFGSRFLGTTHRVLYYWHSVGNWLLTTISNMLSGINLTDMECCYKAFRREILDRVALRENRFGFEPEFTAKVARLGCRIYEVPVGYSGRTYAEGKKIGWRDGVSALRCILRYNLFG